ncbi:MAG: AI-2E family transporter [Anaerolineae bacterium]|nr:AI-2E family transporter [Anaerolineae bacterium]
MSRQKFNRRPNPIDYSPLWLRVAGVHSWLYLGLVLWSAVIFSLLSAMAGLVVPLIISIIMSMLFYPVVDWLEARRLPRALGSLLVMLLVLTTSITVLWLMVVGVLGQADEIGRQLNAGLVGLNAWMLELNLPGDVVETLANSARGVAPTMLSGLASFFSTSFSSAIAFLTGAFVGSFLLFYLLSDWHRLIGWIGSHLGVPPALGAVLVADTTKAIRLYFYALTLSSIVVSVSIGLTMWLLGLPLAFTIALVTMVTSYVPYLGAIFSGAFAFLVALGSGGLDQALIVLAVVLVMQNVIQTLMQNKMASDQLKMHPLVTFISTIVGGTLAGLLGATLGSPLAATLISAHERLNEHRQAAEHLPAEPEQPLPEESGDASAE